MTQLEANLSVSVDDEAVFVFQVINSGTEPVELQFRSSKTADVAVFTAETEEPVWRWSADKMFSQVIEIRTLEPNQTLEGVYTWEDPRSGEYVAVATLEADIEAKARADFSV